MTNQPPRTQFDRAVNRVGHALAVDAEMAAAHGREAEKGVSVPAPRDALPYMRSFSRETPLLTQGGIESDTPPIATTEAAPFINRKRLIAWAAAGAILVPSVVAADRALQGDHGPDYGPVAAAIQSKQANQTPLQIPTQPTQAEINAFPPSP
jgi:hypothetical protein